MRFPGRHITLPFLARVGAAWSVLFAVVHLYWAAGGPAGMGGEPADTTGARIYIAVIAFIGLGAAAVAAGHTQAWGERIGRRRLTVLARAGATALLLGVAVGVGRWLADGGVGDDGAAGVAITLYFLLGGMLFAALARRRASA